MTLWPAYPPPKWWVSDMKQRNWNQLMNSARHCSRVLGRRVRVEGFLDGKGRWHYIVMREG